MDLAEFDKELDLICGLSPQTEEKTSARAWWQLGKGKQDNFTPVTYADVEEEEDEEETVLTPPDQFEFVTRSVIWDDPDDSIPEKDLIQRWQTKKDPKDLEAIMARNKGFLDQQVRSYERKFRLPTPYLRGAIYNNFHRSLKAADPKKGNVRTRYKAWEGLNLHKVFRQRAQFARAERGVVGKIDEVRKVQEQFELDQMRAPTVEELYENTGANVTVTDIKKILKVDRGDLLGSKNLTVEDSVDKQRQVTRAIQRVMEYHSGRHRKMLGHVVGIGGEYIDSNKKLAKQFGVSEQYMSNLKQRFRQDLHEELQRMGV